MAKHTSLSSSNFSLDKLTTFLQDIFLKKAPAMPVAAKEALVKYVPYVVIIFLILSLPLILGALGLGALALPFSVFGGPGAVAGLSFAMIFLLVTLVLEALSIPGLLARKRSGWNYAYYAALINAVYSLLSGNIVNMVVSTALSLWVLFQVREYYK